MLRTVLYRSLRQLHTSSICQAGSKWRLEQGLGARPHEFNAMSELPDWSYVDGTPAPETEEQTRERVQMEEFTRKAIQLMTEMTDARKLHEEKGIEEKAERQRLLDQKLKPREDADRYARIKYKNYHFVSK